jgi:hypothetical protein
VAKTKKKTAKKEARRRAKGKKSKEKTKVRVRMKARMPARKAMAMKSTVTLTKRPRSIQMKNQSYQKSRPKEERVAGEGKGGG